jgi:hypothetical protein
MSVTPWKAFLLEIAVEHSLLGFGLTIFLSIALILGSMHEARILVDSLIPFVKHFKHECDEWRGTWRRLKRELTTWKSDP